MIKQLCRAVLSPKPAMLDKPKLELLSLILNHASLYSPFYSYVQPVSDPFFNYESAQRFLSSLPVLEKESIRLNAEKMATGFYPKGRTYWNTSGGSTGVPVRILQDSHYLACSRYITYSQKQLTGFSWGMPWIKIWGDESEILTGRRDARQIISDKVKNLITLNSFRMSDSDKLDFIRTIEKTSPKLIVSYVQSIYELAKFAKSLGDFNGRIGAIIVTAGTLYPFMRTEIESVFNAPVFNRYGSREVGNISISITSGEPMCISKGVWIEVTDQSGSPLPLGQEGDIVVTSLLNYSMPLIRYRIGDRGILGVRKDKTGKESVVIEQVTGRSVDLFKTSLGDDIDGEYFTHLMYFRSWVSRFQFIQNKTDDITIKIQANSKAPTNELLDIEEKVRLVMGKGCRVSFVFVDDIPESKSGKFRYTISML